MLFRILNGGGEKKYPASSFVLICKGIHANLIADCHYNHYRVGPIVKF